MSEWKKSDADFQKEVNLCSLAGSGIESSSDQAPEPGKDHQYYCLTCKASSDDRHKLCSPALK